MRVIIASENAKQREQLRAPLLGAGLECDAADCVSFAELDARFAHAGADLIAVHVHLDSAAALALIQKASARMSAPVIVIGSTNDPKLVIDSLRGGAREYLEETKLREELPAALEKLRQAGAIRFKVGRTVAITSCCPGSGVTTVASNLAFALAQKHPKQVVLSELATDVPALALALDLQPRHTVSELIRDWDRADPAMLRQGLAEHSGGVQVLAHAAETLIAETVEPPAMRHLALLLRTLYDWTVLDLGHSAHSAAIEAMQLAEAVVVVTRLDVPALRMTRRYLQELEDRGIARERIRPVANFYGQSKQLPWKDAQDALGMPLAVWLPDDQASVNQALNEGQHIVQLARRAKISKRILELAQKLNGQV